MLTTLYFHKLEHGPQTLLTAQRFAPIPAPPAHLFSISTFFIILESLLKAFLCDNKELEKDFFFFYLTDKRLHGNLKATSFRFVCLQTDLYCPLPFYYALIYLKYICPSKNLVCNFAINLIS